MLSQIALSEIGYLSIAALLLVLTSFLTGYAIAKQRLNNLLKSSKLMFEQTAVGMAKVAKDGRFIEVNQLFCQMLGYTAQQLTQLRVMDVIHPDMGRSFLDNAISSFSYQFSMKMH